MRRDIGFYLEARVDQVYQAYLNAASNPPFERDCTQEPYHTISFGVNYSFKYNMNGGSCNIHFAPSGTGTAVNMRFSLAQAAGARYEKYANDLNSAMQNYLHVAPRPAEYNMDDFLKPENQITPATLQPLPSPTNEPVAAPAPQAEPDVRYCATCGSALTPGVRFCSQCGTPTSSPAQKCCPNCKTPAKENAAFCTQCGTRL